MGNDKPCQLDPELWFSESHEVQSAAVRACGTCWFSAQCRELGKDEEYGVWGGVVAPGTTRNTTPPKTIERLRLNEERARRHTWAMELHAQGISHAEIGRTVGLSASSVRDLINRRKKKQEANAA